MSTRTSHRFTSILSYGIFVASLFTTTLVHGYNLGGVSCAAAPQNFSTYCIDGFGFTQYVSAVTNPVNFGPGGTVPVAVTVTPLSSFTPAALAGVNGIVVPWWADSDATAHVANVVSFFLNGGDLFILADDSVNDPINDALGIRTLDTAGSGTPFPTTGNAPLYAGPFGTAAIVNQFFAIGRLDVPTVLAHGGHVVGNDVKGNVSAAVWDRNEYAPGAGRLVIVTDVDMIVAGSGNPGSATYTPPNDNGRFALNATAFLVNGGTVNGFPYDLIGVPSCATRSDGFLFYCGVGGILASLNAALQDTTNFGGPGAPVGRRGAMVEFDTFTPALAARLKAVIIPWIQKFPVSDAASYATPLRDWFLAGGNLWLLQDDPDHDPIGALLGVPTPTAIGTGGRATNGVAPAYDGPFGLATDVMQTGSAGALDPAQVAAHGGTIVGHATDGTNDAVVAVWHNNDYAPAAGRMVIAYGRRFNRHLLFHAARRKHGLVEKYPGVPADRPAGRHQRTDNHLRIQPQLTVAAERQAGTVTVSGNISDSGVGLLAGSARFSVADEYGQTQPSGAIAVGGTGTYAFNLALVAARDGNDQDGRHYTITVTATDKAGNVGTCQTVVTVPHDKGKN